MSKKIVIVVVGFIMIVGVGVTLLLNVTTKDRVATPIKESQEETTIETSVLSSSLNEFVDPSGFKFKYPVNFAVSTTNQVNENVYSSLTLSSDEFAGKTSILVEATDAKSLDDWLLKNAKKISSEKLQKIKLADLDARQYEQDKKAITVAYDTGVLFTITTELTTKRETMLNLHKTIITTFAFAPPASSGESQSSDTSEEDVYFEGEEVIE